MMKNLILQFNDNQQFDDKTKQLKLNLGVYKFGPYKNVPALQ